MQSLSIVICDDSLPASDTVAGTVERLLASQDIPCSIRSFASPEAALTHCLTACPELVLLDIDMPRLDGVTLGRTLTEMPSPPDIIYVSGREDKVFQALQVRPFGFVRKGHFMKDIADTMQAYIRHYQEKADVRKLIVSTRSDTFAVPVQSILYIECTQAVQRLFVTTQTEPISITSRMHTLESELEADGFIRIHKGYLVNFRRIERILNDTLIMHNGAELPISRLKKQEVREKYLELCRKSGAMLF